MFCPKYYRVLLPFLLLNMFALGSAMISVVDQFGKHLKTFMDKEAQFSMFLTSTLKGLIVMSNPPNACDIIEKPTFFTNSSVSRFVLINGTSSRDCLALTKAKNAEIAGFDLAVIFGVDFWAPDYFNKLAVAIPVRYITTVDGETIKERYLYNNSSSEVDFIVATPIPDDISYYIKLFSVVIGVCLVIIIFFMVCMLIKCIQERRRSRRNRLSSRQIRQLATETFKPGDQYDICAICIEDYKEGEKLRILPCSHAYHKRCVDTWLMENRRNCPLCKRKVHFGDSSSDSDTDSELLSPSEDTPLVGSSNSNPLFGTFGGPSEAGAAARSAPALIHHSAPRDVDPGALASAEGSVNSTDGEDTEPHWYLSCEIAPLSSHRNPNV